MSKHQPRKLLWHNIPEKLSNYDLTIDIGEIKHASIKMKTTGKVSRKVLRKWHKRDYTLNKSKHCFCITRQKHSWIPATVFPVPQRMKDLNPDYAIEHRKSFWWKCVKCHCVTAWVYETELSEPMLNAYKEHTRNYDDYDHERPPWLTKALSSATPYSEDSISVSGHEED